MAIAESQQLDVSRSGEYTVAEWLRLWFELYAKPSIRPSTAGYYRRGIEQYTAPPIGAIKLNKLTSREIQKLYKDLLENGRTREQQKKKKPGLSGSTVRGVHTMLHSALDRAVKERLLIRNPADGCVVPKAQHQEMKTLRPEDLKAYLDAAERRGALAMFYLELVSGIRKGELVALRWEDLDVPNKTISVSKQATKDEDNHLIVACPKTENSVRQISIPQEAVELLVREHTKHPDNPWLFPSSRTGEMYHPDSVATRHQRIIDIRIGPGAPPVHDLRHTFATLALQNGRRHQDRLRHAGPLRRRIHSPHLHPHHEAKAGRGRHDHGQPHGAGTIRTARNKQHSAPVGKPNFPAGALRFFRPCGSACGSITCRHSAVL